jgi:hypothetical protein
MSRTVMVVLIYHCHEPTYLCSFVLSTYITVLSTAILLMRRQFPEDYERISGDPTIN